MKTAPLTSFRALLAALVWVLLAGCGGAAVVGPDGPLHWIHDDFDGALAAAKERDVPLVVDLWAPWCHTCLSMKHYVLRDPSLADLADRFVWVALDTDRPENAAAVEQLAPTSWPTFFVLDPDNGSVLARFQGAGSLEQFRAFLGAGEAGRRTAGDEEDPAALARRGDRAAVSGDFSAAESAYAVALKQAPAGWSRRPDVLVSRIAALYRADRYSECVVLALEEMESTGSSASASDFLQYASFCAGQLPVDDPSKAGFYERARARLEANMADSDAPLSSDDQSDGLRILRDVHLALGDEGSARATAERQVVVLDEAAKNAPNPSAAATYNWPRAEVFVFLGRGAEILPALEASAAALPDDYDPVYRVAWVALKVGDLARAKSAAEQTMSLVYGPRKARVEKLLAEIEAAIEAETATKEVPSK